MAFHESTGYRRIDPFGAYEDDPASVCFAKVLASGEP